MTAQCASTGKLLPFQSPARDAQSAVVDDSKADVSSFKLDLNAVPAAVREDDFVDSVVQDYLKFLASGASDSDGAASGFWTDHLVALSFGLTLQRQVKPKNKSELLVRRFVARRH